MLKVGTTPGGVCVIDKTVLKQRAKQVLRNTIGEPYVGKRLKLRRVSPAMKRLDLHPETILDAGAEDATFVYWLARRYPEAQVLAIDIDEAAIAACLATRPAAFADRVNFKVSYFSDLEPQSVDLVTAFDVLEHIKDDAGAAKDLFAALRPGGYLLVHVPRDVWTHRDGRQERVPDSEAWRINPGHVRQGYSPEGMRALLEGAGFEVLKQDTWVRRYGVIAHTVYEKLEHPAPLRILSVPVTDVMSVLDKRRPAAEGNTVWTVARKPVA